MTETQRHPSMLRRAVANAARYAMMAAIVACGIQSAWAYFDCPKSGAGAAVEPQLDDLGAWTFAGDGLAVSVKMVSAEEIEASLTAPATMDSDLPPKADGETRLL